MAKKAKQDKKSKDVKGGESSLSANPYASASIRRGKARGGLAGFVFGGLVAYASGAGLFGIGLWALISGIVMSLLFWWLSILLWQTALPAEITARQREAWDAYQVELERRRSEQEDE